ncbi:RNA recognition motif domain-containing protein [Thaumasiovibrio subtropicus]|uniref:RNA recognition motif domain-containing protein n=1 Tax=Thaumasiovibrio subtropicus TaxID=1891207 RepID=UPI000B35A192|nr:RNA-binding protein [Thaumasiovibrio subtropicus]
MKSSLLITTLIVAVVGFSLLTFTSFSLPANLAFALGAIITGFFITLRSPSASPTDSPTVLSSSSSEPPGSRTLYVGNLPYRANESDVKTLFESHGEVFAVRLMKDKRTGKRRGFGFVVMRSQDANSAIEALNESDYQSRKLKVREANEPKHQEA